MNSEGISIINKVGGTITGERASALPIRLVTNNSTIKYFSLGFLVCILILIITITLASRKVAVVEYTGVNPNYKEYSIQ
jgi:hypothetical protein